MFAQMVMPCKKYKEYFDRVISAFNFGNCPDDRIEKGEVPRWSASPNRRYRDIDPAIRRQGQIFEDYVALEHFKSDATLDLRFAGYGSTSVTLAGGGCGCAVILQREPFFRNLSKRGRLHLTQVSISHPLAPSTRRFMFFLHPLNQIPLLYPMNIPVNIH